MKLTGIGITKVRNMTAGKIMGNVAVPVSVVPNDGTRKVYDNAIATYLVTDADISAGRFKLDGNAKEIALPVIAAGSNDKVDSGILLPIYPVSGSFNTWNPLNLSGLVLWVDGSDLALNDGDLISTWTDKSGNGNNATSSGANRPTFKKNVFVNRSVARFTSHYLTADSISSLFTGTDKPFSFFMVGKWQTVTGVAWALNRSTTLNPTKWFGASGTNYNLTIRNDSNQSIVASGGTMDLNLHVIVGFSTGTAFTLYVDNVKIIDAANITRGAATFDIFAIGKNYYGSGSNAPFKGDIAEFGFYNGNIGASGATLLYNYLSPKYSDQTTVFFGDSIVLGTGASDAAHYWINVVAAARPWGNAVNSGLGSTVLQNTVQNTVTTIGSAAYNNGRDTYTTRVTAYNPKRVFILYGLNDIRLNDAAFSDALYQNDLGEVVDGIIAAGVPAGKIIIGSPPYIPNASYSLYSPWNGGSGVKHAAYVTAAAAVASAKGTLYKDIYQYMADNGGDTLISADGIHPNDAGHAAIAAAFLTVV